MPRIPSAAIPWLLIAGLLLLFALSGFFGTTEDTLPPMTLDPTQPTPAEDSNLSPLQELIESQEIPSPREMQYLAKLEDGLAMGRERHKPVLYIRARSADDPDWVAFLDALEEHLVPRAVFAVCVRVLRYQADVSATPIIELHTSEPVTLSMGHYLRLEDGRYEFVVEDTPSAKGFVASVAPPASEAAPDESLSTDPLVFSRNGHQLMRHRIVEFFAGVEDVFEFGRRTWAVAQGECRIDELLTDLSLARCAEPELRLLLDDEFFGLLTADQRIRAMTLLLSRHPQDLWSVHRVCRIIFGPDVQDPLEFLPSCREAWPEEGSATRELFESQVDYYVFRNPRSAMERLERVAKMEKDSPHPLERLVRFSLIGAREAEDPAQRAAMIERAGEAIRDLRAIDSRFPDLQNFERLHERLSESREESGDPSVPDVEGPQGPGR